MKTLLLTGGNGAIGHEILNTFQNKNYHVIAPTRFEMDLSSPNSVSAFMQQLQPPVHAFIHCAGFNTPKPVTELTRADIELTMQINAYSFYEIVCHLLPQFKKLKSGRILGVSSIYGAFARKNRLAYVASKHALNGMIKTLALELGSHQILVNGIAPGFVDTKMTHKNNTPTVIESFKRKIPLGRLAAPVEMADLCYFLCSKENTYITGEIITADGGYSAGGFQA